MTGIRGTARMTLRVVKFVWRILRSFTGLVVRVLRVKEGWRRFRPVIFYWFLEFIGATVPIWVPAVGGFSKAQDAMDHGDWILTAIVIVVLCGLSALAIEYTRHARTKKQDRTINLRILNLRRVVWINGISARVVIHSISHPYGNLLSVDNDSWISHAVEHVYDSSIAHEFKGR